MSDEHSVPEQPSTPAEPPSQAPAFAPDDVREAVAQALEIPADEIDQERDLFELGLDSLAVMRLAGEWRRRGIAVTFRDLVQDPVLGSWSALLTERAQQASIDMPSPALTPDTGYDEEAPFALATMQHAYWIGRQDGQPLGGVAAHFYVELDGEGVDPVRLEGALRALSERHGMLRARFDDEGRQHYGAPGTGLVVHDLRELPADEVTDTLETLRERHTHGRLDIAAGEVFRVSLCLLPGGRTRLQLDLDMMAGDALSLRVLLTDLHRLYERPDVSLPAFGLDYGRYLAEHARRRGAERERAARWWRDRLPDLPRAPRLPTTVDPLRPVSAADSALTHSRRLHHWLDPDAKAALLARARLHGITPAAALATAFAEVIAAWSDTHRFLLNLPLFDREMLTPDVAGLIGDFSGSVLLDADMSAALPFTEQARLLQDGLQAGVAHGAYGGVEVLRDLARLEGAPVLAPIVYTSAIGLGEIFTPDVQATFGRPVWIISQGPQVFLDAQVTELDGGLLLNWDVRDGVLAPGVPDAAFDAYRRLVTDLLTTSEAWLLPVGPLLAADRLPVRAVAALPAAPQPGHVLHTRFFRLADERPGHLAVVKEDGSALTYAELALVARKVATLLRHHGVREGDTVAITLPKGADQIAAVLGVLAAGAAYAPVGVEQPAIRRSRIHAMAGAAVVLTDDAHAHLCADLPEVAVLRLADAEELPPGPVAHPGPDSAAYLLFTSGSTGLPKGVEVSHRAIVNTVDAMGDQFGVGPGDRTLAISALDFDLATYDIFAPLSVGGQVVVVGQEHRRDAHHWAHLVREHKVSIVQCVPALLDLLMAAGGDAGLGDTLRLVLLGGDWVGLDQPARLRALVPGCRFVALGGMTEAAVHSTVFEVDEVDPSWKSIPYGVPLRNMRARVVDGRGRDCPDQVPGELWIGGPSVATGYRGDPERTASRFVDHDGDRWYRSGDLARYRPDGVLEFLGRADHQVKIGGHRIELGEVEAALEEHPDVLHAVATVLETPVRRLAAAVSVISPTGGRPDPDLLRSRAAEQLPAYMLPEHVLVMDTMPLTSNGKLDRAAVRRVLTASAREHPVAAQAPSGPVETVVAGVWAELLGVRDVSRGDGFFALGGDSLIATRMIGRLRAAGVGGARVAALFANPILREFSALLTLRPDTPGPSTAPSTAPTTVLSSDPGHAYEPFALTDVQAAYHTGRDPGFTLGGVGTWHYSEFDGAQVDLGRLERAWQTLIRRHGMLRAVVREGTQQVLEAVAPYRIDCQESDAAGTDEALAALRERMSRQVRDPGHWPLFAVAAVRYPGPSGSVRTRLAIGLDYLVLDALSITTLYAELNALYADPDTSLPAIELSFRDYLTQLPADPRSTERARAHWQARLEELPPVPALPLDRNPALLETPRFTRRQLRLDAAAWRTVKERAARHRLTPSTVLLAAYGEVLATWSGTDALTLTLTLFNRREVHPHVHRVLGDFTSLSLAAYRRSGDGWLSAAAALQRRQAEDLDHQDVPIAWLLREFARRTGILDAAAPVVFTSALGVGDAGLSDPASGFPPKVWGISQSPQVILDNQVTEESGELVVTWDAVEELFSDGVLDAMFDAHTRLIHHLADGDWTAPIPDLLPAAQRQRRTAVALEEEGDPVTPRLLHEAFFERAAAEPDRTALVTSEGGTTSYGALADGALRTAATLLERGVRPGDLVAISLPKGPEQITAVLGVLAAGAAYVPIGLDQPAARRDRIRTAAGIGLTLGERPAPPRANTPDDTGAHQVMSLQEALSHEPLERAHRVPVEALAYVIFTSGSTGEPKGVKISHTAAWNTVADIGTRHDIGPGDRVFALSALDFDLSVYDIFGLLSAGGSLLLPTDELRHEPRRWPALVHRHDVTVWNTVPALLDLLLDAAEHAVADSETLRGLRVALVSGDWIGLDLPGRLRALTVRPCRFVAMGGATEASVWSNTLTVEKVDPSWASIPYGRPLTGQRYRVVDGFGRDCPDWTPGELWIGGAGLAMGYLDDPRRTAEKFPTHDGQRWYRTGDLGRYRSDGLLEFLGRLDTQLKIAGHRIEAGEVEAAIEAHPDISRAAVVAAGERTARRLVAFAVPRELPDDPLIAHDAAGPDATRLADRLHRWLGERLAAYAIPSRVLLLAALPLTANGKIDRAELALLAARDTSSANAEPPQGEVETALAGLWDAQLPGSALDRNANFFTTGGDSLSAIRLVSAIERRFGTGITIRTLLAAPTIAALGAEITATVAGATDVEIGEL
ncbi:amino acid adenylation domain-containing protein [Streptosporangium sp. NBC_01755]|uniref:non-ribosomal peptide synthetase n=1 Tax=Streptosporangium sp. NBC_01755 TaxID=2975949 RepID=UPI002DDC0426|nr:non-ribosomal peptide synthetase [Streptosporangium sp. NBC_01755]WSC99918.1 amino acid adenylation domain-containing protein [Streptosporangium sp. NBC_01755]